MHDMDVWCTDSISGDTHDMVVWGATPKGQMSNSGLGPAIANLPIQLKSLFEPRAPLDYKPPLRKRKMPPYAGLCSADGSDYFLKQV